MVVYMNKLVKNRKFQIIILVFLVCLVTISIRAGIRTSGGDGSLDDPYTLELD